MHLHRIELMGPEYVLILGVWWSATVVLTVLVMMIRQAVARWRERRVAKHQRVRTVIG
jgi:hypothetical protein